MRTEKEKKNFLLLSKKFVFVCRFLQSMKDLVFQFSETLKDWKRLVRRAISKKQKSEKKFCLK